MKVHVEIDCTPEEARTFMGRRVASEAAERHPSGARRERVPRGLRAVLRIHLPADLSWTCPLGAKFIGDDLPSDLDPQYVPQPACQETPEM